MYLKRTSLWCIVIFACTLTTCRSQETLTSKVLQLKKWLRPPDAITCKLHIEDVEENAQRTKYNNPRTYFGWVRLPEMYFSYTNALSQPEIYATDGVDEWIAVDGILCISERKGVREFGGRAQTYLLDFVVEPVIDLVFMKDIRAALSCTEKQNLEVDSTSLSFDYVFTNLQHYACEESFAARFDKSLQPLSIVTSGKIQSNQKSADPWSLFSLHVELSDFQKLSDQGPLLPKRIEICAPRGADKWQATCEYAITHESHKTEPPLGAFSDPITGERNPIRIIYDARHDEMHCFLVDTNGLRTPVSFRKACLTSTATYRD